MKVYSKEVVRQVRELRAVGSTYREINQRLGLAIPKSTLSYLCKGISPGNGYTERIQAESAAKLVFMRELAVRKNKEIFQNNLSSIRNKSDYVNTLIRDKQVAKIALSMLYLGEGAKWKSRRGLLLGSSDPKIVSMYIELLYFCFDIPRSNMHCRIQHRADQNSDELLEYWSGITKIPKNRFYPSYIDKRTIGKTTSKQEYKGVCSITCAGTHVQLELAIIADIISDTMGH